MNSLAKIVFRLGSDVEPFLHLESTGFLGYTGMRFRMSLPENDGMLFAFDELADHAFWMKDVEIPLDIIFIDNDEKVVYIHENATPNSTTPISSGKPVRYVVEANAGWCKENNIVIGTPIEFQGVM